MHRHLGALFLAGVLGLAASPALARDVKVGAIEIGGPWARATPKGAKMGAAYMKITNTGTTPDRLVSGSSDIAAEFEMHETSMQGGVAKMRPVQGGLEIKPGETVEFKPGSYHVMFVDLKKPLTKGDQVKATLQFEKAGKVDVTFDVQGAGAQMPMSGHKM